MKIFIYANCQEAGLRQFLPLVANEKRKLEFFSLENFTAIRTRMDLDEVEEHLRQADVFIYHPVGADHGAYATVGDDSILSRTKSDCVRLSFPYIYNSGLWPCFIEGEAVINGSALDKFLSAGASAADIQAFYDQGKLEFDLLRRFHLSLETLRERERDLDIKVAPVVEREYRKRRLFLTQNHPTDFLFEEVSRQIVRRLFPDDPIDTNSHLTEDGNRTCLPGRYPLDRYSIEELGLTFQVQSDDGARSYYHDLLQKYTIEWIGRQNEKRV